MTAKTPYLRVETTEIQQWLESLEGLHRLNGSGGLALHELNLIHKNHVKAMAGLRKVLQQTLKPCRSPYCECSEGKCSHPGCYDARGEEVPKTCQEPDTDLTARGMLWEDCQALMKQACAEAGVEWGEEKKPKSIAINVMQRLANSAHKAGFKLALERVAAAKQAKPPLSADAENYGKHLNNAAWEAYYAWDSGKMGPVTGPIFNNLKGVVRAAILKYIEGVESNEIPTEPVQVPTPR
jgi:hypothetical protein